MTLNSRFLFFRMGMVCQNNAARARPHLVGLSGDLAKGTLARVQPARFGAIAECVNREFWIGLAMRQWTQGFQPIIIPVPGQAVQLAIETIGGLSVGANPSSAYNNPAAVLPASQPNPVTVVVRCSNVPLAHESS